jgi:hypothetical protein
MLELKSWEQNVSWNVGPFEINGARIEGALTLTD